jgi:anaerobic selenocysteine-containing dehydrogenase
MTQVKDKVAVVCPYCAVGCGFYIKVEEGRATGIEYMPDHPTSRGSLCPKGNAALEVLNHSHRLQHPLMRSGDGFLPISSLAAASLRQSPC